MLYPPTRVCLSFGCTSYRAENNICTLSEPVLYKATLFTLRQGSFPVFAISYCCHGGIPKPGCNVSLMITPVCHQRYHLNYRVHQASSERIYYDGVPEIIQVAQHFFFESALLEYFAISQLFAW